MLRDEASGAAPYENLRAVTRLHRVPATAEFDQAADFILARAKEYGLQDVHAEQFPIDGKIHYGLMRSHLGWQVGFGKHVAGGAAAHSCSGIGPPIRSGLPITATAPMWKRRWSMSAPEPLRRIMPARMCAAKSCSPMAFCRPCSVWR